MGKVDRLKTIVATMTADLGLPSAEVIGNPQAEVKDEVLKRVFSEEGETRGAGRGDGRADAQ